MTEARKRFEFQIDQVWKSTHSSCFQGIATLTIVDKAAAVMAQAVCDTQTLSLDASTIGGVPRNVDESDPLSNHSVSRIRSLMVWFQTRHKMYSDRSDIDT